MFTRVIVALVALAVAFAILGADGQPPIRNAPLSRTSAVSGQQMYDTYCSACHGKDGKGDGPAASALKTAVPDLTRLSAKNNGFFPELRVFSSIQGDRELPPAHGSRDTPIWGDGFQTMSRQGAAASQMKLASVTAYIKDLQSK